MYPLTSERGRAGNKVETGAPSLRNTKQDTARDEISRDRGTGHTPQPHLTTNPKYSHCKKNHMIHPPYSEWVPYPVQFPAFGPKQPATLKAYKHEVTIQILRSLQYLPSRAKCPPKTPAYLRLRLRRTIHDHGAPLSRRRSGRGGRSSRIPKPPNLRRKRRGQHLKANQNQETLCRTRVRQRNDYSQSPRHPPRESSTQAECSGPENSSPENGKRLTPHNAAKLTRSSWQIVVA